jgi:hypothetical protein
MPPTSVAYVNDLFSNFSAFWYPLRNVLHGPTSSLAATLPPPSMPPGEPAARDGSKRAVDSLEQGYLIPNFIQ